MLQGQGPQRSEFILELRRHHLAMIEEVHQSPQACGGPEIPNASQEFEIKKMTFYMILTIHRSL